MRAPTPTQHRRRRRRTGFTLVEILLSLSILAMLMAAAAMGLYAANASHRYNTEKTDLVTRARAVLDRIAKELRRAYDFQIEDGGATLVIRFSENGGDSFYETRTYTWDGQIGGALDLVVDDGTTATYTLTRMVRSFACQDLSPACGVRIELAGSQAEAEAQMTGTPRRNIF
jgi:prepilin-type N-terminal cleavage/methylation domain-containing protein